jgi:hypothetical protein
MINKKVSEQINSKLFSKNEAERGKNYLKVCQKAISRYAQS